MCWLSKFFTGTIERPSPSDIIQETGIIADNFGAKIIIDLRQNNIGLVNQPKVWIPPIPDKNSMDGAFDIGNNNILIAGADEADQKRMIDFINVGDIAVYRTATFYAIHRVVEIGNDEQGKFYRFKGDNNPVRDPEKIRENEIKWLSLGVIY